MFGGYVKVRESLNVRIMNWVFLNQVIETKAMLFIYGLGFLHGIHT